MSQRTIVLFLLLNLMFNIHATLHFKATSLECKANEKYFYNYTCRLKPINRYKSLIYVTAHLRKIVKNVSVDASLYARNDVNIYRPFLINITFNACQYLANLKTGYYAKVLIKILSKFSNVNHTCPYSGVVFVRDLYFDTDYVPPIAIPTNTYKIVYRIYEGYPREQIGYISGIFDILESRH